ncbi:N-acetylglucosamine-specific PTS transporter subunit IIBC [Metabacillus indicus]|uniref:N-acetylglucosamine-specific PTS transporter subunit IIBC n=1 Tax=Metabacillus indicus TaxID=246786 RepID=UPI002A026B69|nr:N-acetylglucosamine-specific PTS transporter subunit IIBC [Metabacillus indicus]MDX8290925.1 N-acetylglucosamine-specific PTS transporter subunit IIBC [Metabacillus indicus]
MLGFLQKIGKSLQLPIAVLPAAGLMLRLGQDDLLGIPLLAQTGDFIFANLALIFAIGVAIGLSKDGHGSAALAGTIGYLVLTKGIEVINPDIKLSVLGGIIAGIIAGLLYNRFSEIKLPEWLAFFGGRRFVPIITAAVMLILSLAFGYLWGPVQEGINNVGVWLTEAGAAGVAIYGFLNRILIPVGLHQFINSLVWFVFGEYNGATGDLNRFFAGDPSAGFFMSGMFPIMMFGLPAAAAAMIMAAKKERRKAVSGLLIGVAFTSFLTGITEPIEFMFMFLSPLLYVIHAVLTGASMAIAQLLDIHLGFTFSAGAIDYVLNFNAPAAKNAWLLLVMGAVYAAIYFFLFYFLIKKLDLKTPGREDETDEEAISEPAAGGDKYATMAAKYMAGLGGSDNLTEIDNCVTRLRLKVKDAGAIDEKALKQAGARGVIKLTKTDVQVIVGTDVEFVSNELKKLK